MGVTYNSIIPPFKWDNRKPVGRRPKGNGPGPGWETVNPPVVREGFLANYGLHLALALVGLAASVGIILAVVLAGSSMQYGFVVLIGAGLAALMSAALPFFWYSRFRIISGASLA